MPMITFTKEDEQRIRNPFHSELTVFHIEDALDCTGEECGERILLSKEDQERYGCPTSQDPLGLHYHVVVSGINPTSGPWRYAVSK
jgi:hypothetical protein